MNEERWGDLLVDGDDRRRQIRARDGNGIDGVEVAPDGRRLTVSFLDRVPEGLTHRHVRIDAPPGGRRVRAVSVRRSAPDDPELEDTLSVELDRPGSAGRYRLGLVEPGPGGRPGREPYRGIDPRFAHTSFVFDIDAPLPPISRRPGAPPPPMEEISYLARDYEGLRQLMLDRLAVTIPNFTERHVPDVWIALVELLAYTGDDLSYYEDAVATEAYLQTARRRISIRRHARLLGYRLHDGCSARAWVCVSVSRPVDLPLGRLRFAAAGAIADGRPLIDAGRQPPAFLGALTQFTPLPAVHPAADGVTQALHPAHDEMALWSWGEANSRLAIGATSAVLRDGRPGARTLALRPGDVIVLEELHQLEPPRHPGHVAPPGPPDPTHRQAVRLTAVHEVTDPLYDQPLLDVRWGHEDALTFELPVRIAGHRACRALGNVVLVSHGIATQERLPLTGTDTVSLTAAEVSFSVPFPDGVLVGRHQARVLAGLYDSWRAWLERHRRAAAAGRPLSEGAVDELRRQLGADECRRLGLGADKDDDVDERARRDADGLAELLAHADRLLARRRRRLQTLAALAEASGPLDSVLIEELTDDWGPRLTAALAPATPGGWGPAASAITQDPRSALPIAALQSAQATWEPAVDLIGIDPGERAFVAEVDEQGLAHLRVNAPPGVGAALQATYIVGNGSAGNVVAEAINAIVWLGDGARPAATSGAGGSGPLAAVTAVRNPLPASGGVEPEDSATARLAIPGSFADRQPRALTAEDYAQIAGTLPGVRRAAAELRFTGSVAVADVAVQPALGEDPPATLLHSTEVALRDVRRVGHVVRVHAPRYRPLVIRLDVALDPNTIRASAADELAALLSDGWLADGRPAVFNPERIGFGQSVFASAVIAAVQEADGVVSVVLERFAFYGDRSGAAASPPAALHVGGMEIVRLDNDPANPQNGYAVVSLRGGR